LKRKQKEIGILLGRNDIKYELCVLAPLREAYPLRVKKLRAPRKIGGWDQ
jgi:hypothetical protein